MFLNRTILAGGKSKAELRRELELYGVKLNQAGGDLFEHEAFTTSEDSYLLECVELSVADLGYGEGATIDAIYGKASQLGLSLCPLELAPHLRLQYLDQPEGSLGHPPSLHRAPSGSLTIAAAPLSEDDEAPKGFYLRRINGELWLRGYRSGPEHVWSPEDRLIFCRNPGPA